MRKEGERRAGALIGAGENGDSLFFFLLFFTDRRAGGEQRFPSFGVPNPSPPCLRYDLNVLRDARSAEDPSPLSHDPTLVTYQVRMPASLVSPVAQPPRTVAPLPGHSPH